jgi:Mn2+/Fe2+ NRAMP family transporter
MFKAVFHPLARHTARASLTRGGLAFAAAILADAARAATSDTRTLTQVHEQLHEVAPDWMAWLWRALALLAGAVFAWVLIRLACGRQGRDDGHQPKPR